MRNNSVGAVGNAMVRSSWEQHHGKELEMSTITLDQPVSRAELWGGRILSGLVILFLLFDGAIKLIPLDVVTQTMDQTGRVRRG